MADYTLSAKITADIKGFVSNINTVTKKAESMAEKLSSSMQPVKTAAASAKEDIAALADGFQQWTAASPTIQKIKTQIEQMMQAFQNSAAGTALQNLETKMKELISPIQSAASQMKSLAEAAKDKALGILSSTAEKAKTGIEALKNSIQRTVSESKAFQTISAEINAIKPFASAVAGTVEHVFQSAFSAIQSAASKVPDAIKSIVSTAKSTLNTISDLSDKASKALESVGKSAESIGSGLQSAGDNLSSLGGKITAVETAAAGLATVGLKKATDSAIDFDTQMRKVGAISSSTDEELQALRGSALELGASTSLSSSEVAEAMTEMAAKGSDANQIIADMPGIISAAEASGEDLSLVADTVSNAMNAFGDSAGDATHVADVLAQSANQSAAGVSDLQYAFKYAAPLASSLGISMEELAAATGVMTDAGLEGSQAGTTLRAMFVSMSKPTDEAREAMEQLGISFYDSEGKMKSISTIVSDLQTATADLTDEEKEQALATMFGTESLSGLQAMMNATPGTIDKMTDSLKNCDGASEEAAAKMKDGVGGAIENMQGAIESFQITIGTALLPMIQTAANTISDLFADMTAGFNENGITGVVDAIIGKLQELTQPELFSPIYENVTTVQTTIGKVVDKVDDLWQKFQELQDAGVPFGKIAAAAAAVGPSLMVAGKAVSAVGTAISGIGKVASTLSSGFGMLSKLSAVLGGLSTPVFLVVAAIAALAAGFIYCYTTSEDFRNTVSDAFSGILPAIQTVIDTLKPLFQEFGTKLSELFQAISPTIETLMTAVTKIVGVIAENLIPIIGKIIEVVMEVVNALLPIITPIINWVLQFVSDLITALTPIVEWILKAALSIVGWIQSAIEWIGNAVVTVKDWIVNTVEETKEKIDLAIAIVSALFESIKETIQNIVSAIKDWISEKVEAAKEIISNVVDAVSGFFSNLKETISGIFDSIADKIRSVMNTVKGIFENVLDGIESLWNGLSDFVGGIFDGIGTAFDNLISGAKSLINNFVDGLNFAIDIINAIPGVSIGYVDYLAHGTDDWSGGFAIMNEGGRGELVNLPNGSQVIPHDISKKYAQEAARVNATEVMFIDYDRLITGIASAMQGVSVNSTVNLDGKAVSKGIAPYMDTDLGRLQGAAKRYAT